MSSRGAFLEAVEAGDPGFQKSLRERRLGDVEDSSVGGDRTLARCARLTLGDNPSGGWNSYRASKAALNMLLKTAAVEFARRARNVKLIAFQPGTADTFLSRPFQGSVKPGNLHTPEFVAEHLVDIMNAQTMDSELSFIDWENKAIAW